MARPRSWPRSCGVSRRGYRCARPTGKRGTGRQVGAAQPGSGAAVASVVKVVVVAFALIVGRAARRVFSAEEKGKLADSNGRLADSNGRLAEEKGAFAEEKGTWPRPTPTWPPTRSGPARMSRSALQREERERKQKEVELLLARSNLLTGQLLRVQATSEQDPAQVCGCCTITTAASIDLRRRLALLRSRPPQPRARDPGEERPGFPWARLSSPTGR